jgi:hypothetical protein
MFVTEIAIQERDIAAQRDGRQREQPRELVA